MTLAAGAYVVRDAVVTIDDDPYQNQLKKARLVPSQSVQTYTTAVPEGVYQDFGTPVWTFEAEGLQINTTGGFAKALRDAQGTTVEVVLQPKSGFSQPMATFSVVIPAVAFGFDEAGQFMDIDVSMPVVGQPVFGTSASS
jgi:hypothetical protein